MNTYILGDVIHEVKYIHNWLKTLFMPWNTKNFGLRHSSDKREMIHKIGNITELLNDVQNDQVPLMNKKYFSCINFILESTKYVSICIKYMAINLLRLLINQLRVLCMNYVFSCIKYDLSGLQSSMIIHVVYTINYVLRCFIPLLV